MFNRLGIPGTPLPEGFVHNLEIPKFLTTEYESSSSTKLVERGGVWGRTWKFGPLRFEKYVSDTEPQIQSAPYPRLILWQPITRQENISSLWKRNILFPDMVRQIGFVDVAQDYTKQWDYGARRDLSRWRRASGVKLETSDYQTFINEYPRVGKYRSIRSLIGGIVRRKVERYGDKVHFYAVKKIDTGKVLAMMALLELKEYNKIYYVGAFATPEGTAIRATTGLVEQCFRYCLEHNIRFLDFGCFWVPGDLSTWKGYSHFKQKFGTILVRYPAQRWRYVPARVQ